MGRREILLCPVGELLDMAAWGAILEGGAQQQVEGTIDDLMKLR